MITHPDGTEEFVHYKHDPRDPNSISEDNVYVVYEDRDGIMWFGTYRNGLNRFDPETGINIAPPKSPITRFKGNNWLPDYSSDGKYLAYVTGKRNLPRNLLIIHNLETGEERELSTNIHKIQKHIWSPDCSSILFRGEDENYNAGIYQIDIQTGTVRTLVPKYSDSRSLQVMQWSDDGKSFYMIRGFKSTKTLQIVIREIESGTEKLQNKDMHCLNLFLGV